MGLKDKQGQGQKGSASAWRDFEKTWVVSNSYMFQTFVLFRETFLRKNRKKFGILPNRGGGAQWTKIKEYSTLIRGIREN